jgi:small subunit ribosomal protein S11
MVLRAAFPSSSRLSRHAWLARHSSTGQAPAGIFPSMLDSMMKNSGFPKPPATPTDPTSATSQQLGPPGGHNPTNQPQRLEDVAHLHCKSTQNNTILTLRYFAFNKLHPDGYWTSRSFSSGILKFKGANKATYEAGYACAMSMINFMKSLKELPAEIAVYLNGMGQGREALFRAILTDDAVSIRERVKRLTDTTPLKIGGTKPKKMRRL